MQVMMPTVLFYSHYDVQPADDLDLWKTPPFEAASAEGQHLCARCIRRQRQLLMLWLRRFEALLRANGALPVNVKFIVEGRAAVTV